jgi:hypothetical protein
MGYRHIQNLYRSDAILMFRRCISTEKVHGTSANLSYNAELDKLSFFSGGASYDVFVNLFDQKKLLAKFRENKEHHPDVKQIVIYGEAYGGKMQAVSAIYGPTLQFIAFEVCIDDYWLSVERAYSFVQKFELEFVPFEEINCTMEAIDAARDADSIVAIRRGMGPGKMREGVVLRPVVELLIPPDGGRIICKHKRAEFSERVTQPKLPIDPGELKVLEDAKAIADEWVVPGRVKNILSHWAPGDIKIDNTRRFLDAMIEDVEREAAGEIVISKAARGAICKQAALLFKKELASR